MSENILLIKITATQDEVALSYHRVRGLYFVAVAFAATIIIFNSSYMIIYSNMIIYSISYYQVDLKLIQMISNNLEVCISKFYRNDMFNWI